MDKAIGKFKDKFNIQLILDVQTLEEAVYQLDNQLQNTLEEVVPLITKTSKHKKKPLYEKQLNDQRKILKKRERKWLKYKRQGLWLTYKRERNRYSAVLTFQKRHSLFTLIEENSKDAKKLYKLVSQLTGQKQENILPEEDDDTKLAGQFREFFLSKIINIRKLFHNIPLCKTHQDTVPRLEKFSTISEADLKTIIHQMPNKLCQLDILKTTTLKKVKDT